MVVGTTRSTPASLVISCFASIVTLNRQPLYRRLFRGSSLYLRSGSSLGQFARNPIRVPVLDTIDKARHARIESATVSPMTRYLGIDYGTKRIGLAVGDDATGIASPITVVQSRGRSADDIQAVIAVAQEYGVDAFVVGLPLNMDDTEGPQAKLTRRFGDALARSADKPVHYHDERLSTCAADDLLQPAELTRKKKKRVADAVAAQVILQGFLESLPRTDG